MKQILAIFDDPEQRKLFAWLCSAAGVHAHLSDGALPALTELERTAVDAVICSENAGDMSGEEFRNIVRYEPATRLTPFYLLWNDMPEHLGVPPNYDLPATRTLLDTTSDLLERLRVDLPASGVAMSSEARLLSSTEGGTDGDLNGDFEGVTLDELLNWVAEMELSGHWHIWPSGGRPSGHLVVQSGDVIYAEYDRYFGRDATLELLDDTRQHPDTRFSFFAGTLPAGPAPRNITERTERLLMEIMVDFDHRQAERQGIDTSQAS